MERPLILGLMKVASAPIGGNTVDRDGYFYPPTVIVDLRDGVRLVDEEQFGPVIPVIASDDGDSEIAAVNAGS